MSPQNVFLGEVVPDINPMLDRARKFIETVRWQRAKTYEKKAPHEYTVKNWDSELETEYQWFVNYIKEAGVKEKFWTKTYSYLYLDGYRYWAIGNRVPERSVINRCEEDQVRQ